MNNVGPPFDAAAARRLRLGLRMGYDHVSYAIRQAYGLHVPADAVAAWEHGLAEPTHRELAVLAGVLWCAPADLMGAPGTLREHRLARSVAVEDVARALGMPVECYLTAEESGRWTGTPQQTARLAAVLRLPLPALLDITGGSAELAALLRDAMASRWQAYVRAVVKLTGLSKPVAEVALRGLHSEYQGIASGALTWGQDGIQANSRAAGEAFLGDIVERFWAAARG